MNPALSVAVGCGLGVLLILAALFIAVFVAEYKNRRDAQFHARMSRASREEENE